MRKYLTLITALFMAASLRAQIPEKMSYQAVIRNASDILVKSTDIGMRISILHGSVTGTAVYVETQTPTTNANGLASVSIGAGTVVNGDFASIDWTSGPYFIKTETDINGGTSYTITGTSQLLSVPYALHAKTSESVVGGVTESDPVFNAWDKDYGDLINTPSVADGSETKVTAGTNISITGFGTEESPYTISTKSLTIGQAYQGGIIFWLDATGQHGLIAATADQSTEIQWYNGTYRYTGTTGDGLYAGLMNTAMIVATQMADNQTGNFAAKVCADYSVTVDGVTYGDWYLPSKYELNLLYNQRNAVGGFASAYYWSSTEDNNYNLWMQYFGNGNQFSNGKNYTHRVRAVRAF